MYNVPPTLKMGAKDGNVDSNSNTGPNCVCAFDRQQFTALCAVRSHASCLARFPPVFTRVVSGAKTSVPVTVMR